MRKTYYGSCHCGAVRFECEIDLAAADTSRCNCSICARTRYWKTLVKAEDFRLLQGADALAEYSSARTHPPPFLQHLRREGLRARQIST